MTDPERTALVERLRKRNAAPIGFKPRLDPDCLAAADALDADAAEIAKLRAEVERLRAALVAYVSALDVNIPDDGVLKGQLTLWSVADSTHRYCLCGENNSYSSAALSYLLHVQEVAHAALKETP